MKRAAYTMVELLVVLVVIAIIIAILIPATLRYRERARVNACHNSLREFGIGFNIFGERDARKRFCTGAYDLRRDGCPDTNSWVGNLISLGAATPGNMLCSGNPVRGIESLNQLIGNATGGNVVTETLEGVKMSNITGGFCANFAITVDPNQSDRATPDSPIANFGKELNGSAQRLLAVHKAIQAGYNTNYSQSWFLARQDLRYARHSTEPRTLQTRGNQRDQSGGYPGCSVRFVEKSFMATSAVPMLGDAAPGDVSQAILSDNLSFALQKGDRLGVAFGNGPSFINTPTVTAFSPPPLEILSAWTTEGVSVSRWGVAPAKLSPVPMPVLRGRNYEEQFVTAFFNDTLPLPDEETYGGVDIVMGGDADGQTDQNIHGKVDGYGGRDGILVLQDTRNFLAVHGSGQQRQCNILFADTAVKTLMDLNGDGYLNPGFPVTPTVNPSKEERAGLRASTGYENNRCEVAPFEFYNGPVLDDSMNRPPRCCGCY